MQEYVLGFAFDLECNNVVLIEKNRPHWQKGKLNGVGGKIENNETPYIAMQREFLEETGVNIKKWYNFCTLVGSDFKVYCFKVNALINDVKTMEDEIVNIYNVSEIQYIHALENLKWLISLALDNNVQKTVVFY